MRPDELMARCAAQGVDLILTFQQTVPEGQERALRNYDGPIPKQTRVLKQPEWTAEDAAGACQGLDWRYYAAFAFRFAGDESQRNRLRVGLMRDAMRLAVRDGWKKHRPCANCDASGYVHEIIYDEEIDSRTGRTKRKARGKPGDWETKRIRCPICRPFSVSGGQVMVVPQLVDLAIFEEWLTVHYVTGLLELAKERCYAGLIGIDQAEWERAVNKQYRAVQCIIDRWCGIAYSHMNQRMGKESTDEVA